MGDVRERGRQEGKQERREAGREGGRQGWRDEMGEIDRDCGEVQRSE